MNKILFVILATTLLLAACGPEPAPTMSMDEIQGTAVAAAMTMVAQTQAAIPTSTPVPPTDTPAPTPLPTNTVPPLQLPTQPVVAVQPSPTTASSSGDDCNHYLAADAAGPTAPIKIINQTKAAMNVSLYLDKTVFGECGYRGYSIPKNNSILIDFPQGNIYGYAWILEPINKTISGGPYRPNNTDKWELRISESGIKFVGP